MLKVQDFLPDEYKQSAPSAAFLDTSSSNQTLPTALPEKPKKKKKAIIIPMLLGVLLLVGGAVSYALVQQNQDIRQSADVNEDNKCTPGKDGDTCQMNGGKKSGNVQLRTHQSVQQVVVAQMLALEEAAARHTE
jgi:flagellar basal body-associated protein FliL